MSRTRAIAVDTLAILAGKMIGLVLGLLRLNYIAKFLGLGTLGILNWAAFLFSLLTVIGDFGLPSILTRNIAREYPATQRLLSAGLGFKILALVCVAICVAGILLFSGFDAPTAHAVLLTLGAFVFTSGANVLVSALQAHRKMKLVSIALLLNDALNSIAVLVLISSLPSITTVLVIGLVVAVLNFIFLGILCRRFFGPFRPAFDRALFAEFRRDGYPLALSALGISINLYLGSVVMKYACIDAEIGYYGVAYKLFSILILLPTSITQVIYPILSNFFTSNPLKLPKAFRDSLRVMALVSVPVAFGTVVLSDKIIQLVFPQPEFAPAGLILAILVGSVAFGHLNSVVVTLLVAANRQNAAMVASLTIAALAVAANAIFVPLYGPVAVASVVAGTDLAFFTGFFFYLKRTEYSFSLLALYGKPVVASSCMVAVLLLLPQLPVLVAVALGVVVYAVTIFFIRGLGEQERDLLQGILRKLA
jgi:O-antigen/teichoic acid export membrane protein